MPTPPVFGPRITAGATHPLARAPSLDAPHRADARPFSERVASLRAPPLASAPASAPASAANTANAPVATLRAPAASAPPAPAAASPLGEAAQALLQRVARGERLVEGAVRRGVRGAPYTPEELLLVQAQVYRSAQDLELFSKLVERATSGVKTVLQQS